MLDTKKGNPLSLAMLYQILASQLDVPIFGVNLPNHFLLCYLDENHCGMDSDDIDDHGALFYINPFSGGTIIHKDEIDDFLFHLNLPKKVKYYRPCDNKQIISRMINNLIFAYTQQNNEKKVDELTELQSIFTLKVSEES
ncbi:MAG: transglutaminase family protein [Flavobacteriales bacterium]